MNSPLYPAALRKLSSWYRRNRRGMPWRGIKDPYKIWVSEILLQQTQVETVRPYYERFITNFPTVEKLAQAPIAKILKAWEGCGYYARARNLHKAAKIISNNGGKLPETSPALLELPGIGPYTSAAIASIAFGEAVPVIDGNVKRVLARVLKESRIITDPKAEKNLSKAAEALMQSAVKLKISPSDFNQAMMELGATICKSRVPLCPQCPISTDCRAYQTLRDLSVLPHKALKKAIPHFDIGAAIVHKNGRILISQRPEDRMLGGLWEFPGGKKEKRETLQACVRRELKEELGIRVSVGKLFCQVNHAYSHFKITLHCFECKHLSGEIQKIGVADFKWVRPSELKKFAFPKADRVIIEKLTAKALN